MEQARAGGLEYIQTLQTMIEKLLHTEWPNIRLGAIAVANAIASGNQIFAFGTGHSHMIAEELYYRAGGFTSIRPILFEGLMLHSNARLSTQLERLSGLAPLLFAEHGIAAGDVLIIASNSGGNATVSEMTSHASDRAVHTIAVTSRRHAASATARKTGYARIHEIAEVVIDNGGVPGDAAVHVTSTLPPVGPTSTVMGALIVNALMVESARELAARGITPAIYASSNTDQAARTPSNAGS